MSKARDLAGIFNLNPTSGTTAQRPATAEVGEIYYNGTTGKTQIYTPTGWQDMASGIPYGNTAGRPAAVTGQPYFNGETARLEMYTATGWQNIVQEVPGVASITGTYSEATNSGTITIQGTNFVSGAIASAIGANGVEIPAASTTFSSLVQLVAVFTDLSNAQEPYDIKVTNPSNLFGLIPDALYVNASPVWVTASGSLGIFAEQVSMSVSATTTDSDSNTITYALASGSTLPSGITLNSSTGLISGTLPDVSSNTTYTFTINASDGLNTIPRTFSFISNAAPVWTTASGSLGSFNELSSLNVSVAATDATESLSYSLASGSSLPSGVSLNSSTGAITGTVPSNTTYTFTINASDGINTVARQFSFTSLVILNGSTVQRAAPSPKYLKSIGITTSGSYYFKNSGYNSGTAFQAFADLSVGDGYIITSGIQLSGSVVTSYSEFGTAATSASGTQGYNSNFYLPTANILSGWSGDTTNRFIVGMTNRSGTDIASASGKEWFVLNVTPSVAKNWFDNTPGTAEYSGTVVASSSGTIPQSGASVWSSGHGGGVMQLNAIGTPSVNQKLWMELRDSGTDSNHSAVVYGDGNGAYYAGGNPFSTRWMFMGFSPGNMS